MTPIDLRTICDSLNDEHRTGGQSMLARLLGWNYSTLWRKLNGKSRITQRDELAIWQALAGMEVGRLCTALSPEALSE
jgi:Bacterial regulatory protein, Fis family